MRPGMIKVSSEDRALGRRLEVEADSVTSVYPLFFPNEIELIE